MNIDIRWLKKSKVDVYTSYDFPFEMGVVHHLNKPEDTMWIDLVAVDMNIFKRCYILLYYPFLEKERAFLFEETGIPIQHNYVDMQFITSFMLPNYLVCWHDNAAYKLNYVPCRQRSSLKQELSFLFHFENTWSQNSQLAFKRKRLFINIIILYNFYPTGQHTTW